MKKATVLDVLVKPINGKKENQERIAFEKIKKIINSCENNHHLNKCLSLITIYKERFFDNYKEFYYKLYDIWNTKFNEIIGS